MADYLKVGDVVVPVAWPDGAESDTEEFGDREPAFAGNMLSSIRARYDRHHVRTRPMDPSDASALLAALEASPPLTCTGDLVGGSASCDVEIQGKPMITVANNERRVILRFTLYET